MGLIISRFRRKKTTIETLERIETKINALEQDGQYKELTHKRVIGYIMAYSVGLYVLFAILYYFFYVGNSQSWLHSVMHASPLLMLPILVIFLRSAISWYYTWSLNRNRIKLNKLREEKKKILDDVMNKETYKKAKIILDRFGCGDDQKALKPFVPSPNVPGNNVKSPSPLSANVPRNPPVSPLPATPGQLRQRQLALTSTPINKNLNVVALNNSTAIYNGPRLRSDQLPRPLLDKNRSALDKVVDYLFKEGPNHRMALVCSQCFSHNGMAIIEEFEYVSYVCAYCGKLNPARKQRPAAPMLAPTPRLALQQREIGSGDDSSVPSSGSESEEEKKPFDGPSKNTSSDVDSDRAPSPIVAEPKPYEDKKQD